MTPPVGPCVRADTHRRTRLRLLQHRPLLKLNLAVLLLLLVVIGVRGPLFGEPSTPPAAPAGSPAAPSVAQAARPDSRYSIDDFLATTSLSGAAFSADRTSILYSSDQTGVYNAFAVPVGVGPRGS